MPVVLDQDNSINEISQSFTTINEVLSCSCNLILSCPHFKEKLEQFKALYEAQDRKITVLQKKLKAAYRKVRKLEQYREVTYSSHLLFQYIFYTLICVTGNGRIG